ncbi:uncharacterized mitochondrial protein AtMg00310-like [Rutidosis leptorrhynchoides]|uniref:uncharacterized mitochondrial protein AtMg00310-like n=1 Tax=Rutidosis leptorrhynchoides TaxID=125765 RepID=UPI003A99C0EA
MGSLGIYFMSLFKCPESVLKQIESIRSRFFWGGNQLNKKLTWVKWDKVLAPFDHGGLNIGSLKAFNIALVSKCRWRYVNNPDALCLSIIKSIHGDIFVNTSGNGSSYWHNIVSTCSKAETVGILPSNIFHMVIGNGTKVRFWHDLWCGNTTLFSRFNRLYHLDLCKDDMVANKWVDGHWQWTWTREYLGTRNEQLLCSLQNDIDNIQLSDRIDSWSCSISNDGLYTVKDARLVIDRKILPVLDTNTIWFKFLPNKVNIFLWRFRLDALPTRWNLSARGI